MKRYLFLLPILLLLLLLPLSASGKEMRGVWVSSVYNLDYPSKPGLSESALRAEADKIIKNAEGLNMNAIFLQVRPASDALYKSGVFPTSAYLADRQGGEIGFDPLKYFIEKTHEKGIELHAWINPYRVTPGSFKSREAALDSLCESHPARLDPELTLFAEDGRLYFDPGQAGTRELILAGISEILENYDADGIHFDDYFYPSADYDDMETFNAAGSGAADIGDFRRESVNRLIESASALCREKGVQFGVSPFGIWANSSSKADGSDTVGNQSYFSSYADSKAWIENGWVDYIAPQLYWAIGGREGEFETLLSWWSNLAKANNVRLYPGLAAYRSAESNAQAPWAEGAEIINQLDMMDMKESADGVIFFRYGSLMASKALSGALRERFQRGDKEERNPVFIKGEDFAFVQESGRVANRTADISCTAREGEKVIAFSGDNAVLLKRQGETLTGKLEAGDKPVFLVSSRFGCVSVRRETGKIVSNMPEASITDIDCGESDGYNTVSFKTRRECVAWSELKNGYLKLYISPCRGGYIFESPAIEKAVTEVKNGVLCYTFKTYTQVTEHFAVEYDDRIDLFFR